MNITTLRFVNVILLSELSTDILWEIIRKYRIKYLIENISKLHQELSCFNYNDGYRVLDPYGMKYVREIEEKLKLLGSTHTNFDLDSVYDDFDEEKYRIAGEMFIYLTQCPKFMFEWTQLYVDLLQNASPDVIVQTLNRIMITGRMKGDNIVTDIAKNIFMMTSTNLSLEYQTIDSFTKSNQNITNKIDKNLTGKKRGKL